MAIEKPPQRKFMKVLHDTNKDELIKFINEHLEDMRWSVVQMDKDHGFHNAVLIYEDE